MYSPCLKACWPLQQMKDGLSLSGCFILALEAMINFSHVHFQCVILRCSLCISYLHWINATHWWRVFESMFINGFFKCLKIKSLTYWWSFQSCPGREKELELERVLRSSWTTASRLKTTDGSERRRRWVEEFFWEEDAPSHRRGVPFDFFILAVLPEKMSLVAGRRTKQKATQCFIVLH